MAAVAHYVEINAPAQACYDWRHPLTRLPEFMSDAHKAVDEFKTIIEAR